MAGLAAARKLPAGLGFVAVEGALDVGDLSSVGAEGEDVGGDEVVVEDMGAAPGELVGALGEEKKDVMDALALGFLAVLVATSAAFLLSGVAMTIANFSEGGSRLFRFYDLWKPDESRL